LSIGNFTRTKEKRRRMDSRSISARKCHGRRHSLKGDILLGRLVKGKRLQKEFSEIRRRDRALRGVFWGCFRKRGGDWLKKDVRT